MTLTRIKLARMHRGLRQLDVSRLAGISESYLSKIETGRAAPSDILLVRLAEVLNVAVVDLVGEIESPTMGRSA
jgi:transcriptional regulator with XRE-family HTH domain